MSERPTRETVLMDVAAVIAKRSTCRRIPQGVGAVLERDGRIISTGYAGAPARLAHCEQAGCDLSKPCVRTVHAEANAIVFAGRHGIATDGATMYCTWSPCYGCAKLIINAGIKKLVFKTKYRDVDGLLLLEEAGVETVQWLP